MASWLRRMSVFRKPSVSALILCGVALLAACSTGTGTGSASVSGTPSPTSTEPTTTATNTPAATPTLAPTSQPGPTLSQQSVYVGDGNGDFFALNAQSGGKRWSTSVSTEANKPLANNGIVYITTQAGYVIAINAGNILWQNRVTPPAAALMGDLRSTTACSTPRTMLG